MRINPNVIKLSVRDVFNINPGKSSVICAVGATIGGKQEGRGIQKQHVMLVGMHIIEPPFECCYLPGVSVICSAPKVNAEYIDFICVKRVDFYFPKIPSEPAQDTL